jgi:AcrR family transcriptional regulator
MSDERLPRAQQSERARAAILRAAQLRFAESGYDATTIRTVAADARIDPSMVIRYYGSKDGLFAAATAVDLAIPDLAAIPADEIGTAVARHFITVWESHGSGTPLRVLLSSALAGGVAAARMSEIFATQLRPVLSALHPESAEGSAQRAALVASQVLGFALTRYVLQLPPIVHLSEDAAVAWLAPTIQAYLVGPVPTLAPS